MMGEHPTGDGRGATTKTKSTNSITDHPTFLRENPDLDNQEAVTSTVQASLDIGPQRRVIFHNDFFVLHAQALWGENGEDDESQTYQFTMPPATLTPRFWSQSFNEHHPNPQEPMNDPEDSNEVESLPQLEDDSLQPPQASNDTNAGRQSTAQEC